MGYIYARRIKAGKMTLADVPARWHDATIDAYFELFGIHLDD